VRSEREAAANKMVPQRGPKQGTKNVPKTYRKFGTPKESVERGAPKRYPEMGPKSYFVGEADLVPSADASAPAAQRRGCALGALTPEGKEEGDTRGNVLRRCRGDEGARAILCVRSARSRERGLAGVRKEGARDDRSAAAPSGRAAADAADQKPDAELRDGGSVAGGDSELEHDRCSHGSADVFRARPDF